MGMMAGMEGGADGVLLVDAWKWISCELSVGRPDEGTEPTGLCEAGRRDDYSRASAGVEGAVDVRLCPNGGAEAGYDAALEAVYWFDEGRDGSVQRGL